MNETKILGYRKFNSKKGEPYCVMAVTSPYTDRDIQFGACGFKSEDIFIPKDFHDIVTPQCIGKTAVFGFIISGGKAYVDSVTIK